MTHIKHDYFVAVELLLQWQGEIIAHDLEIIAHDLEKHLSISSATAKKFHQRLIKNIPPHLSLITSVNAN